MHEMAASMRLGCTTPKRNKLPWIRELYLETYISASRDPDCSTIIVIPPRAHLRLNQVSAPGN